jgi:hypothetical protein
LNNFFPVLLTIEHHHIQKDNQLNSNTVPRQNYESLIHTGDLWDTRIELPTHSRNINRTTATYCHAASCVEHKQAALQQMCIPEPHSHNKRRDESHPSPPYSPDDRLQRCCLLRVTHREGNSQKRRKSVKRTEHHCSYAAHATSLMVFRCWLCILTCLPIKRFTSSWRRRRRGPLLRQPFQAS